jgi:hypothetical protein
LSDVAHDAPISAKFSDTHGCTARVKGVTMGQATVDLPDPLPETASTPASADDLLSQLAGEEIERLLAEAEKDLPPVATAPAAEGDIAVVAVDAPAVGAPQPEPTEPPSTADAAAETLQVAAITPELEEAIANAPESSVSEIDPARPLPGFLQPLAALSAAVPPSLRDALGKIAIVTLLNSLAVIIYVVMFRHR